MYSRQLLLRSTVSDERECVCVQSLHAAKGVYMVVLRQNQKIFNLQISLKPLLLKVRTLFAHL